MVRTDFSDEGAWRSICATVQAPTGEFGFQAYVQFLNDPACDGLTADRLMILLPSDYNHSFIFLVDETTLRHPEHPIVVIDLFDQRGRTFRVIPSEMWSVENNLSLANMDFDEFADNVDPDGVFRGFPES